jgi:hypothetical protein
MKVFKITLSSMVILALASCGSSKADERQETDSAEAQEVTAQTEQTATQEEALPVEEEAPAVDHSANFKVIRTVYDKFVFGSAESNPNTYFTPKALKKLAKAYEYDCDEGDCYAYWELRTAAQDGPSDTQKVISVDPDEEDGWYVVAYNDMGNKGKTRVKIVDGKIDDYKRIK